MPFRDYVTVLDGLLTFTIKSLVLIECVRCHAVKDKIKNHAVDGHCHEDVAVLGHLR